MEIINFYSLSVPKIYQYGNTDVHGQSSNRYSSSYLRPIRLLIQLSESTTFTVFCPGLLPSLILFCPRLWSNWVIGGLLETTDVRWDGGFDSGR